MEFSVSLTVTENGRKKPKYTIQSDLNGKLSLEELLVFSKLNLINISLNALEEEQAKGFPKDPIITVDNKRGKPIALVSPLGRIFFTRKIALGATLLEVYDAILARSIRGSTGTYLSQNFVIANGRIVATSRPELDAWIKTSPKLEANSLVHFVNMTPYAGMLEREGFNAKSRGMLNADRVKLRKSTDERMRSLEFVRRENGAYYLAWRAVRRKFKTTTKIRFNYLNGGQLNFSHPQVAKSAGKTRFRRTFKEGGRYKGPYVYPAISIQVDPQGFIS